MKKQPNNLQNIPGIGPSLCNDLHVIGIETIQDLKGKNPEELFATLCAYHKKKKKIDRCVLYVFREAVYFAETPEKDRSPHKCKWWNWKDTKN